MVNVEITPARTTESKGHSGALARGARLNHSQDGGRSTTLQAEGCRGFTRTVVVQAGGLRPIMGSAGHARLTGCDSLLHAAALY